MKLTVRTILTAASLTAACAWATPSTTYWTPACADVQPWKTLHLGVDNYFTVDRKASTDNPGSFPTDLGVTVGVSPLQKLQVEIGFDALYPSDYPYYLSAKVGTPESALFPGSPALNVGIFNVGLKHGSTDQNVLDVIAGRTLPLELGRIHAGAYIGNRRVLVDADGRPEATGWMVGYDRTLIADKLALAADYMSGDNALGGGGAGLSYSFARNASILFGPVWFNSESINGSTKWTTQLDIVF